MRRRWWIVGLGCLVVACAPRFANVPPEPPGPYARAEANLRRGEHAAAIEGLKAYLEDPRADPTYRARAYYRLAQAHLAAKDYQAAVDTLARLEIEYPQDHWPQVAALRGDTEFELENHTAAYLAWEDAWARGTVEDREALRPRLTGGLDALTDDELRELNDLLTIPEIRAMIEPRVPPPPAPVEVAALTPPPDVVSEPGAALGPEAAALPPYEEPFAGVAGAPAEVTETGPFRTAEPTEPEGPRVAALLPLTGPDKAYGSRVLNGLRLAYADAPHLLLVRDTGGDPAAAATLLQEVAADPTVLAVLGPMRGSEAEAVVPQADDAGIPVVLLAQQEVAGGRYVVQTSMTRRQEVQRLAEHAARTLHASRFGVLYPDDTYGRTFLALFQEAARRQGGRVVGTGPYVPGQTEFRAEAALAASWGADAVFMPDNARTAAALGAAVRAAAPRVALLGTESWNRPTTLAQAGEALEGAVFADAFFIGSERPSTREFVERFQNRMHRAPTVFEAQGYDAAMLVRRAIESGAVTREDVLAHVRSAGPYDGAGRLLATDSGVERELFLLRVRGGRIEEVPAGG
jgi:ABC-type branched-subunit amino acid transport system substrate-binding protein